MTKIQLKQLIKKILNELLNEHTFCIISFDKSIKDDFGLLKEGIEKWKPASEKGYWFRLNTPKFDFEQRHVHIARTKHINTKNKQVSWNIDGTRHDRLTFNNNFVGMEKAKAITLKVLDLPPDTVLESVIKTKDRQLLLESAGYSPTNKSIFIFEIPRINKIQKLYS